MIDFVATFIFFFTVIDPIGTVPVFIAVTSGRSEKTKRIIAIKAALVAAIVLVFFVVAGELILTGMDVPIEAFQIAGGIVLFLFAISMIFGESKPEEELKMVEESTESAIFPLAIPSIAGPGAMLAAVLMTENNRFDLLQQIITTGVMLGVVMIAMVLMLIAAPVHRLIGDAGASIISRVMGLILSAVAVTNVLAGIKEYFLL